MRIDATLGKLITGLQYSAIEHLNSGTVRNQIGLGLTGLLVGNHDLTLFLGILNGSNTAKLCDDCKTLRLSCFKKLLYTGKTLCDIVTGNTTGMEGTHRKLCTGFTDRLCCNDTDSFTDLNSLIGICAMFAP